MTHVQTGNIIKHPGLNNPIFDLINEDSEYPFSFSQFLNIVEHYLQLFPGLRYGQAIFNLVDAIDSDFNDDACGTDWDCFSIDNNVTTYVIKAFERGIFKF